MTDDARKLAHAFAVRWGMGCMRTANGKDVHGTRCNMMTSEIGALIEAASTPRTPRGETCACAEMWGVLSSGECFGCGKPRIEASASPPVGPGDPDYRTGFEMAVEAEQAMMGGATQPKGEAPKARCGKPCSLKCDKPCVLPPGHDDDHRCGTGDAP